MDIILYNIIACLICLILGYFFGSIPTGVILCRLFYKEDPRNFGSKNSGGTNVGRTFGMKMGGFTIFLDALKTILPMIIVFLVLKFSNLTEIFIEKYGQNFFHNGQLLLLIAPLGAVIGHCWPIFAGFKGGKAAASLAGFVIATSWITFGVTFLAFILTLKLSKHVSLSSIIASVTCAISAWVLYILDAFVDGLNLNFAFWGFGKEQYWVLASIEFAVVATLFCVVLIARHNSNIKRLVSHTESEIKWMK